MSIQKKSLISNLNTTKKAILASTPTETASVMPATKNLASRNTASRNTASRNTASRNTASRNTASRNTAKR